MNRFFMATMVCLGLGFWAQAVPQYSVAHHDVVAASYLSQCYDKVRELLEKGDGFVSFLSHQPLGEFDKTPPNSSLFLTLRRKVSTAVVQGSEPLITLASTERNVVIGKRLENKYECGEIKEDRP